MANTIEISIDVLHVITPDGHEVVMRMSLEDFVAMIQALKSVSNFTVTERDDSGIDNIN